MENRLVFLRATFRVFGMMWMNTLEVITGMVTMNVNVR